MRQTNWKSKTLLAGISSLAAVLLGSAIFATLSLPFFGSAGLASALVLVVLTLAASRVTVSMTSTDGVRCSPKSVADAFVFLAVMLYAMPPAGTVGPAVVLAAIIGLVSTYRLTTKREMIFTAGMAVISTFVAASFYCLLVDQFLKYFE